MNFFKTVFPTDGGDSTAASATAAVDDGDGDGGDGDTTAGGGAWSFGGLLKTIATKSETFVETYRRDLEEFGAGLKKETAVFAGAIKDLPSSLEAGASAAQIGLESVGQTIDDLGTSVWQGTADIISHGKGALLAASDDDDDDDGPASDLQKNGVFGFDPAVRYSRFDALVYAIQSDPATYCDEPEDGEEFDRWRKAVSLEEKGEEIGTLAGFEGAMEGVYNKLVPSVVDHEIFWLRYFYKVYKLKQAEDARANLVKRAISGDDEEDLSWEVEDEDEQQQVVNEGMVGDHTDSGGAEEAVATIEDDAEKSINVGGVAEPLGEHEVQAVAVDEKSGGKQVHEEEDLGWDEIEDVGSGDEKKGSGSNGSPSKEELRRRLSVAEDDEDLSWDIEDEEPLKQLKRNLRSSEM